MRIRDATKGDFDFIFSGRKEIAREERFRIPSIAKEKKRVRDAIAGKRVRVAVEGGKAVGFTWFIEGSETPFGLDYGEFGLKYLWVDYVFVEKGWRGKGVGKALYADLASIARKRGASRLMGDVFTINSKSIAFHEKLGFEPLLRIYWKKVRK